jgi:glycosyltransferase involved in cell wall biosynthesis
MAQPVNRPFFSVVIANFNYGRFLEEAIVSVLDQSCQDFELIIMDGGSTDNSVEVIRKYQDRIALWCSEKDRGQSHAFNKGFAQAKGRFFTWLNADDLLLPKTLEKAKAKISATTGCSWLTGNLVKFLDDGRIIDARWGPHSMPRMFCQLRAPLGIYGPTSFFSKELWEREGPFDESLYFGMDTDLWLKFVQAGVRRYRLNHCCWGLRMHEMAKTATYAGRTLPQDDRIAFDQEKALLIARYKIARSGFLRSGLILWRILDGSLFVSSFRSVFVRGRRLAELYDLPSKALGKEV